MTQSPDRDTELELQRSKIEAVRDGALDEMMQNPSAPDQAGIIWADFD